MSHFVVLVVGEDVDGILESYDENLQVAPYIDYMKDDIEKEFFEYKQKIIDDGEPVDKLTEFEKLTLSIPKINADWLMQWNGQVFDKNGNTLSRYNPDSKWDWYEIGGRWSGTLILKSGESGVFGSRSWTNKDKDILSNRADQAYKYQIDFNAMNAIECERLSEVWDMFENPNPDTCRYKPEYVKKQRELHLKMYGTKEEYLKQRGYWSPFAYVSEHGWEEPGKMGWWGMSTDDTEDRDQFDKEFVKFISEIDDNELLTIVDCHI